jgi:hypothetical protein
MNFGDRIMFGRNQISDRDLLKAVQQRLARTGTASSSKVNVTVQQGNVTLTGTLQHAIQRDPIVNAVSRVAGVRRVSDQMQHVAKKRLDGGQHLRIAEHTRVAKSFVDCAKMDDEPSENISAESVDSAVEGTTSQAAEE